MALQDNFGLALADIKDWISPRSLSYLTSILRQRSDELDSSDQEVGDRHSSNWSESSGTGGMGTLSADFSDIKSCDTTTKSGGGGRRSEDLECEKGEEKSKKGAVCATGQQQLLPLVVVDEENTTRVTGGKRHLHFLSSSLQQAPLGITFTQKNDALCSHLFPICRKILAKTPPLHRPNTKIGNVKDSDVIRSVSEEVVREKIRGSGERDSPYQELIGKISETRVQKDFARVPLHILLSPEKKVERGNTKRKKQVPTRVCDFSRPITNPLYKVYNPQGYQKTDDEVAVEHIEKIGCEFNEWLGTLEGHAVQLDLQLLTRILRHELQFPDKMTSTHTERTTKNWDFHHPGLGLNFPLSSSQDDSSSIRERQTDTNSVSHLPA